MFQLLESKEEIVKAQQKLESTVRSALKQKVVRDIGYPGGSSLGAQIRTDGKYWFSSHDAAHHPWRLNWFGLFAPDGMLQISVEINTSREASKGGPAGFFARDTETG